MKTVFILLSLFVLRAHAESIPVSPHYALDMDSSAWTAGRGRVAPTQPLITIFSNKKNPNLQVFVSDDTVSGEASPRIPPECRSLIKAKSPKDYCMFDRTVGKDKVRTFLSLKRLDRTDVFAAHMITALLKDAPKDSKAFDAFKITLKKDKP